MDIEQLPQIKQKILKETSEDEIIGQSRIDGNVTDKEKTTEDGKVEAMKAIKTKEIQKIEIVPAGSGGIKISEQEFEKSRKVIDKIEKQKKEMEKIKEKQNRGRLLSSVEIARFNEMEMRQKTLEEIGENEKEELQNKTESEKKSILSETEKGENKESGTEKSENDKEEEKISEEFLDEARDNYTTQYQAFVRKGGMLDRVKLSLGFAPAKREIPPELQKAKDNYTRAKKVFAQSEFDKFKEGIDKDTEIKNKGEYLEDYKNEIFNDVVLGEMERMQKIKLESFPLKKKGILMKSYEKWAGLSKTKRVVYSAVMVAGVAGFASLAVPVSAGAAALGMGGVAGKRLFRGAFGMLVSGLAGKTFERQSKSERDKIEKEHLGGLEKLKTEFHFDNLVEIEDKYQKVFEKAQKGKRNLMLRKMFVMGGAGIGSVMGVGMLENALAGDVSSGAGGVEPQRFKINRPQQPMDTSFVEVPKNVSRVPDDASMEYIGSSEELISGKPAEQAAPFGEKVISKAPLVAVTESSNFSDAPDLHIRIKSGDNLWNFIKEKFPRITELEREGMKDNVVANLIEKIKENPQEYGITSGDVDRLKVGDEINFTKIYQLLNTEKVGGEGLIERARGLNEETLAKIETYRAPLPAETEALTPSLEEKLPVSDQFGKDASEAIADISDADTPLQEDATPVEKNSMADDNVAKNIPAETAPKTEIKSELSISDTPEYKLRVIADSRGESFDFNTRKGPVFFNGKRMSWMLTGEGKIYLEDKLINPNDYVITGTRAEYETFLSESKAETLAGQDMDGESISEQVPTTSEVAKNIIELKERFGDNEFFTDRDYELLEKLYVNDVESDGTSMHSEKLAFFRNGKINEMMIEIKNGKISAYELYILHLHSLGLSRQNIDLLSNTKDDVADLMSDDPIRKGLVMPRISRILESIQEKNSPREYIGDGDVGGSSISEAISSAEPVEQSEIKTAGEGVAQAENLEKDPLVEKIINQQKEPFPADDSKVEILDNTEKIGKIEMDQRLSVKDQELLNKFYVKDGGNPIEKIKSTINEIKEGKISANEIMSLQVHSKGQKYVSEHLFNKLEMEVNNLAGSNNVARRQAERAIERLLLEIHSRIK